MMLKKHQHFFVLAALGLLLLSTTVVSWHHHDGLGGQKCNTCHFVHLPLLQSSLQTPIQPPRLIAHDIPCQLFFEELDAFLLNGATRAPPA